METGDDDGIDKTRKASEQRRSVMIDDDDVLLKLACSCDKEHSRQG